VTAHPALPGSVFRAILILLAGVFLLDLMGALVKVLLVRFNASELSVYRNLIGMVPALVLLYSGKSLPSGRRFRLIRQWPLAFLRGTFGAVAQLLFYFSLGHIEFATVTTILFSTALFSVAFSVPLLREQVGAFRWLAVSVGFAGVIMVVGPGSDAFSPVALLPMGAAALYALSGITARLIDRDVPNALVYLYSAFAALISAIILALTTTTGFSPITSWSDLALILAMGMIGGSGVICLLISYRLAPPSILAPFNYFGILSAFFLGWLIFNETPVDRLFPGVILILAGGLLVIWRESKARSV
jgi:drug/metabolite transporter (DMT)-like permease